MSTKEAPSNCKIIEIKRPECGLHAIIALDDLTMGPALGGTRIFPYANVDDAKRDVMRLARGMTYKSALAETGFGGGKSVIIADPRTQKTPELLQAFAAGVHDLNGDYICAEDVGSSTEDMKLIRQITPYVVGLPHTNSSGDPSRFTAWGVLAGIRAVAHHLWGVDSLRGKTVAIQGLGAVGEKLAEHLFWEGAHLILADIDQKKAQHLADRYWARATQPSEILSVECDILVPCAMGGILTESVLDQLKCQAIAGAANNQLLHDGIGEELKNKKILYAPDFVINAGGIINVSYELSHKGYHPHDAQENVSRIYDTLKEIFKRAEAHDQSTAATAVELAKHKLKHGIGRRSLAPRFPNFTW